MLMKEGNRLKMGVSTSCFKGLNLFETLEILIEKNIRTVEVRLEKEKSVPSIWPWEANNQLSGILENFECVGFHLPFIDINPFSANPLIKNTSNEIIEKAIGVAIKNNGDYVVLHFNTNFKGDMVSKWSNFLLELSKKINGSGLVIGVENAGDLVNIESLVKVVNNTNQKNVRILLDTGHSYVRLKDSFPSHLLRAIDQKLFFVNTKYNMPYKDYSSLSDLIKENRDIIYGFHIHDNNGKIDHLALGKGIIDFSFLDYISDKKFVGPLILESRFNSLSDMDNDLEYIKRIIFGDNA
jgi:sugar phosphate isomerase/epimerase